MCVRVCAGASAHVESRCAAWGLPECGRWSITERLCERMCFWECGGGTHRVHGNARQARGKGTHGGRVRNVGGDLGPEEGHV